MPAECASPCHNTGCQCFTIFLLVLQCTADYRKVMCEWYACVCETERWEMNNKNKRGNNSEKDKETDRWTGKGADTYVQHWNALILCLLHLLLCFGQHPKLMVIIIVVTLHRLCRCSRVVAVWRRLHKHCSCLTKHAFSYGSEMSGVRTIKEGQENTEGLCCYLGMQKVASRWSTVYHLIICLVKWGFCFLFKLLGSHLIHSKMMCQESTYRWMLTMIFTIWVMSKWLSGQNHN